MTNCRRSVAVLLARSAWVQLHSARSLPVQPDWQARRPWLRSDSVAAREAVYRFTKIETDRARM
jgi:hypothetical protein